MPAMGSVQISFQSSVKDIQIIRFLKVKGFKYVENDDSSLLTYRDKHRFDGEITCSLDSNDKKLLNIFPGGHAFQNMDIFIQQLCLDMKDILDGELPDDRKNTTQNSIDNLKGESQAEVFFHGAFYKFINQSFLIEILLRDIQEQRMQKFPYNNIANDKLLDLIEVNVVTNMEIFFRELWKYFLLESKVIPNSVKDKKLERYQIESLISGENDFEGILASSFSFQNMNNISKNLLDVSRGKLQIKDICDKLSKKYNKNFYVNLSSLFSNRHKIVHENENLGYGAFDLREYFYDVVRVIGEIYLLICKDKDYQTIMIHESVMSFSFLEELLEK